MLSYNELIHPSDERVKNILEAGKKHFTKYGFRKASIGQICRDAELSKPTFYKYFSSKETLFFSVLVYDVPNQFAEFIQKSPHVDSAADKLSLYLRASERYLSSNPMIKQIMKHNPQLRRSWSAHPLNYEGYLNTVDLIEEIIKEGLQKGEFEVADIRRTAHVIALATILFALYEPDLAPVSDSISDSELLFELLKYGIKK